MKQDKLVQIKCQGTPDCQWGDIEVYAMRWDHDKRKWEQTLGPVIGYEFAGANDFQDTMEVIKGRYNVVRTQWMSPQPTVTFESDD